MDPARPATKRPAPRGPQAPPARRHPLLAVQPPEETLEHLVAKALGGSNALDNLVLCHAGCNKHLKDRPLARKLQIRAKWHRNAR